MVKLFVGREIESAAAAGPGDWWDEEVKRRKALFEVLPAKGVVPDYISAKARGTVGQWNTAQTFTWGKKSMRYFPKEEQPANAVADINKFITFLSMRIGADSEPMSTKLGPVETKKDGWFRFPFKSFDATALPAVSQGEWDTKANWQRAWHGTKIEALYSILYHGKLAASCDVDRGDRFFEGKPGVYVHSDGTQAKAENYTRYVPLFRDGSLWCVKLEVQVDRSDRIPVARLGTDQWVQTERSVILAALWVCGRTFDSMENGMEIAEAWMPWLEANPQDQRFRDGLKRPLQSEFMVAYNRAKPARTEVAHADEALVPDAGTVDADSGGVMPPGLPLPNGKRWHPPLRDRAAGLLGQGPVGLRKRAKAARSPMRDEDVLAMIAYAAGLVPARPPF